MKIEFFGDRAEKILLQYRWMQHGGFLDIMASHLEELTSGFLQEIEAIASQIEDEWREADYHMDRTDEVEEFHQLGVTLANSFFAYSYSLFENELMDMCRRSKKIHNASCSVTDINDRPGIDDAKEYIAQIGGEFPCDADEWKEILIYRTIRNSIVHRGGMIKSGNRSLKNYARRKGILVGTDNAPGLELTRCFCEESLNVFQQFLLKVLEADPRQTDVSRVTILE